MCIRDEKIREQLHYYNIHSEIDSVYGNWAVTKNGDVVNFEHPLVVLSIHLFDMKWQNDIEKKEWLEPSCKEDFRKALKRARHLYHTRIVE